MVSEVVEAPVQVDPAVPEVAEETESPAPEVEAAAPETEQEPAATSELQVEVTEPEKPNYITREEWEKERAEVASRAAADALESDRRRRQTENARKAKQEAEQRESDQEAVDTLKAALGAKGIYEVPDDSALSAINRIASKKAERMVAASADVVEQAFDFITAPVYGQQVDLDDTFEPAARKLAPKVQHLIDTIRPQIEADARKGYIAESELPAKVDAEIARRAAKSREGQTELVRPDGPPPTGNRNTIEYWEGRIAHEGEDGVPDMSASDWNTYKALRQQHGYS